MNPIYVVVFMFIIFYLMVLRPQRKAQRAKKEMLAMLKKGDEIVTIGGLMGTIRKLGDDWVELEIANRTRVYLKRWAVGSLVSEEEEDELDDEDDAEMIDADTTEEIAAAAEPEVTTAAEVADDSEVAADADAAADEAADEATATV